MIELLLQLRRRCPALWLGGMLWLVCVAAQAADASGLVVVASSNVPKLDAAQVQRLYTGRITEIDGRPVTVANLRAGDPARRAFMRQVMAEDDDKYVAYWIVRRHIGKGIPPRELNTAAEVIQFIQSTPGGLGYILSADLPQGINVVFRP